MRRAACRVFLTATMRDLEKRRVLPHPFTVT
ncbi:hypothetical protein AGR3A_Lc110067 [Agrobacterium tomkonis CFBP 6623]|uniref:Uncharacterized protein n=1 Tax=Agrobacterium tomkonis CFBP 6623 TaxID=1183432 RepID=A0A1S7QYQ4_9HYPH|nr:hypothetical protein AGR3A_Lc110067 [Agrobacterium tomkonis CFBP 6623]